LGQRAVSAALLTDDNRDRKRHGGRSQRFAAGVPPS